jgi:hypothetical protein
VSVVALTKNICHRLWKFRRVRALRHSLAGALGSGWVGAASGGRLRRLGRRGRRVHAAAGARGAGGRLGLCGTGVWAAASCARGVFPSFTFHLHARNA